MLKVIPLREQYELGPLRGQVEDYITETLATIDKTQLEDLATRTGNRYVTGPIRKWLGEKLSVAFYFNLHNSKNQKVLDIGTGAGWMVYLCKKLGHDVLGTDIKNRHDYDPVYEFLNIQDRVIQELVYANTKLNLPQKYNLITCMRGFFSTRGETVWTKKEWKFFFNDIQNYLEDNGHIYLGMNSGGKRSPYKILPESEKSHWGPKDVGEWFEPYVLPAHCRIKGYMKHAILLNKNQLKEIVND